MTVKFDVMSISNRHSWNDYINWISKEWPCCDTNPYDILGRLEFWKSLSSQEKRHLDYFRTLNSVEKETTDELIARFEQRVSVCIDKWTK
jgi:hypothetical protein